MTKRILLLLMVIAAALVVVVAFDKEDLTERANRAEVIDYLGTTLSIPAQEDVSDSSVFWPILKSAAEESEVNVFRKADGFGSNDKPFVAYYVLLTSEKTDFYDAFRLREGRFLNYSETQGGSYYVSSVSSGDTNQVGIIEDLGSNDYYYIYGMEQAFNTYPVAGSYVIEAKYEDGVDVFTTAFRNKLNSAGIDIDLGYIEQGAQESSFVWGSTVSFAETVVWLAIIAVIVMIAYRQLYESKRTAILLLYGNSSFATWYHISGKPITITMVALVIMGTLLAVCVPGTMIGFIVAAALHLAGTAVLFIAASLITLIFIKKIKLQEALKNRKDTLVLASFSLVIKSILVLVLLYMGAVSIAQYSFAQGEQDRLGNWEHTAQYGIYYPYNVGLDGSERGLSDFAPLVFDLYPIFNNEGALFVDASLYVSIALQDGRTGYRSITVNPNYLEVYPVKDTDGNPILISEEEVDWILLVPESYQAEERQIVEQFYAMRNGDDTSSNVWETDEVVFGRTVATVPSSQEVRIIWTEANQEVFSFSPEVYPEKGNIITDPIVQVMTLNNSAGVDRLTSAQGGMDASLKVKLLDGDSSKTYEHYHPLLQKYALDDNYKKLVTLNEAIFSLIGEYNQQIAQYVFQAMLIFVLFLVFILQSVPLLFELDARRTATQRLYGYPFILRHRRFFIIFVSTWVLIALATLLFNSILGWPWSDYGSQDFNTLLLVTGVFFAVEVLVSVIALSFVESRRITDILKGEF